MANEQLRDYIQSQIDRGVARDAIEQAVLKAGWPADAVKTEMAAVTGNSPVSPTVPKINTPVSTSGPVDMFASTETAAGAGNSSDAGMASTMPGLQPRTAVVNQIPAVQTAKTALAPNMMQPTTNSASLFPKGMKPKMVNGMSGRTKVLGIVGVVVIALAVLGGGVYAYMNLAGSGSRTATTALNNLNNLQSVSFAMTVVPQFQQGQINTNPLTNRPITELSLQISGQAAGLTTATPSETATVVAKLQGTGGSDTYQAEIRSVNNTLYTKFGELAGAPAITTTVLKDQWFSLTTQSISAVNSSSASNIDGRILKQLSATELTQLKNALSSSGMVSVGKKDGNETIQNVATVKYPLTLTAAGTKQFVQSIAPVLTARGMTTTQIQAWQKTLEQKGDMKGSIWIGKKDKQIYQFQLAIPVGGSGIEQIVVGVTMWDHNKEVKIEIPSPVKPLDTVLLEAQRASQAAATLPAITTEPTNEEEAATTPATNTNNDLLLEDSGIDDTAAADDTLGTTLDQEEVDVNDSEESVDDTSAPTADSDDDGLSNADETKYKTDPLNDDSDDDGFLDGEEVENGFNPNGDGKL